MERTTRFKTGDRVTYREDGGYGTVADVRLSPHYPNEAYTVVYEIAWDDGQDNGEYLSEQLARNNGASNEVQDQ